MALVDVSIAWVAVHHPRWLFVALPAWAAEQALVNGIGFFSMAALVAVFSAMTLPRRLSRQFV